MSVKQKLSALDMNMPRLYGSRWILCFPLSVDADKAQVFEDLRRSLAHTISSIPWISGDVGPEEGSDPKDSRIQVIEGAGGVEFRCKDLAGILPSYNELKQNNFTFSKLTTRLVSPLQVIQESQPVMAAQANFIEGGLLLAVGVHHSVCDGSGLDHILETWAHNTGVINHSGSFSNYDPMLNDRTPLNNGLPVNDIADFPEYVLMPTPPADKTQMAPPTFQLPPMTAKIFYFSPEHLAGLKTAANAYSTNDALCGFFWHHMTLARNPSNDPTETDKTSAALFAVNIRGRTSPPLPLTYLGNASLGGITQRLSITSLKDAQTGLSQASTALRSGLKAIHRPSRVPLTIGLLSSRPNAQDFKFAARGFLGPDITMTSWADMGVRRREWGPLGKPEGFRIPYEAADGMVVIFPKLENGGLEVMAGLESESMERLLKNPRFQQFAEE
ncbi:transferase [Bisporella sp. PMI_857]|nr:transferase [Bisporella sp. PMI_857]